MTLRLSPVVRVVAAVLAVVGLTAAPLRAFVPCEMQPQAAVVTHERASAEAADPHAGHHGHMLPAAAAGHDAHAMPVAASAAGVPVPDGQRPGPCLDLTHCAVMAWTPLAARFPQAVVRVMRRIAEPDTRLSSVGRSIDTPPPKRA